MEKVILKNCTLDNEPLEATYLPSHGMNLISYRKGDIEAIDQTTFPLFYERFAGLGALIGPHFHQQKEIPTGYDPSLFPHIEKGKKEGRKDPFSHGIGRYVPWKFVCSQTQIQAELHGSTLYKGTSLSTFEGQDFHMKYQARLLSEGLFISFSIESEKPSLIGLHYYYALPKQGVIEGLVKPTYRDGEDWKSLPSLWTKGNHNHLYFPLSQKADFGFLPYRKHLEDHDFQVCLNGKNHSLHIKYTAAAESELSFQIYKKASASFVCIEPLSAKNPKYPRLSHSHLEAKLQIFSIG